MNYPQLGKNGLSPDFFYLIFKELKGLIVLLDENYQIIFSTDSFSQLLGIETSKLFKRQFSDLALNIQQDELKNYLDKLDNEKQENICFESNLKNANGEVEDFNVTVIKRQLENNFAVFILTLTNIKEQTEKEALELRYQAISEQASPALIIHNFAGQILEVNQKVCDKLGYTKDELLNLTILDIEEDYDLESAQKEWAKIKVGQNFILHGHQKRKDGRVFPVEVSFGSFEWQNEQLFLGIIRDISLEQETAENFKKIVEGAPDVIIIQTDFKIRYVNPVGCRLLGVKSLESILNKNIVDFFCDEYQQLIRRSIVDSLSSASKSSELSLQKIKNVKGEEFWAEIKIEPLFYQGVQGSLLFLRDVSDKIYQAEALKRSENKFSKLFNQSSLPTALIRSSDFSYVDVNKVWCEFFDFDKEEVIGKNSLELKIFTDQDKRNELITLLQQKKVLWDVEQRLYSKTGQTKIVLSNFAFINIEAEEHVLVTIQDISQRKKAEKELLASRELFEKAFEHSGIGMCLLDLSGRFIKVNKNLSIMFAAEKDEIIGNNFIDYTHPADIQKSKDAVHKLLAREVESFSLEKKYLTALGKSFWGLVTVALVCDNYGKPQNFIAQIQDISHRKQMEEELKAKEEFNRTVMENLPIGIAVNSVFPTVKFNYMNSKFPLIYQTSYQALSQSDSFWEEVYKDEEYREKLKKRVEKDIQSGDPQAMVWENISLGKKGHQEHFISAYATPLPEKNLLISTVIDVTESNLAKKDLQQKASRLSLLPCIPGILYL